MRNVLATLACSFVLVTAIRGGDPIFPLDDIPASQLGGLIIVRHGNQTTVSLGGVLFPRKVRVKTATPEGPVVAYFKLPSAFQSATRLPLPDAAPASLRVEIPDADGLLYIEGELIHGDGPVRVLQSPPLAPGVDCPLHVRAAFKVGDHFYIEDKQVLLRAGNGVAVTFDGSGATVLLPSSSQAK